MAWSQCTLNVKPAFRCGNLFYILCSTNNCDAVKVTFFNANLEFVPKWWTNTNIAASKRSQYESIQMNAWMNDSFPYQTTHMCSMHTHLISSFFVFNCNTHSTHLQFNAPAREKLFEHVEKSMNRIGFESFYENHNEYTYKTIQCSVYRANKVMWLRFMCVCENFGKQKKNKCEVVAFAMISCIFTISFYHWRNDDKQNSTSTHTRHFARWCQLLR